MRFSLIFLKFFLFHHMNNLFINTTLFIGYMMPLNCHCSERKKWYSYFDNVQAVLFMVALSGYDQNLDENHSKVSIAYLILETLRHITGSF